MKKLFFLFSILMLFSCAEDMTMSVSTSLLNFDATGGSNEIALKCNAKWEIDNPADWIVLSAEKGEGDATIKVTISPNESDESRSASIRITCKNKNLSGSQIASSQLSVHQNGK